MIAPAVSSSVRGPESISWILRAGSFEPSGSIQTGRGALSARQTWRLSATISGRSSATWAGTGSPLWMVASTQTSRLRCGPDATTSGFGLFDWRASAELP